jgi:cob(I)alamin adenosyltransferase
LKAPKGGQLNRGYVQVYTGDGKGKTTAALGLAFRAAGAGLKVFIAQFIKKGRYSEHVALERFSDLITVRQYGHGFILNDKPTDEDMAAAKAGLKEIEAAINSATYDVVIVDEVNVALHYSLIDVEDVLRWIREKPTTVELVLTGRNADDRVIEAADLVTEMKPIKHYYYQGVQARIGIEK